LLNVIFPLTSTSVKRYQQYSTIQWNLHQAFEGFQGRKYYC